MPLIRLHKASGGGGVARWPEQPARLRVPKCHAAACDCWTWVKHNAALSPVSSLQNAAPFRVVRVLLDSIPEKWLVWTARHHQQREYVERWRAKLAVAVQFGCLAPHATPADCCVFSLPLSLRRASDIINTNWPPRVLDVELTGVAQTG
ncbi:hypothetical protein CCHR01_01135 [Colletotrichum chrysophilum]|uniref:Uncharacterized protein n=1 Tax=Colletotrichum chrysophilum TaxID=1836956 RepID=A0AAD9AX27_9PEZI|nr:hypothetical protein CCHR01_01135 [Colletotrichum chrysophilum]